MLNVVAIATVLEQDLCKIIVRPPTGAVPSPRLLAALRKACISPIKANYPNDFKLPDADRDPVGDRLYPT